MKSSGIGGQAVLEGVMMRHKSDYAIAVRRPDGEIAVTKGVYKTIRENALFFRLPIIRGVVAFWESLSLGMRTLTYSASFYEEDEERKEEAKKRKNSGGDVKEKIQMGITLILSIFFAVILFIILPYFLSQMLHQKITSFAALAAAEGGIRIFLFISYVFAISFMGDVHRVFMYHGAEHKVINCIENGLELTVENVRRQSRYHKKCGTSFVIAVVFLSILLCMFIHFDNVWLRFVTRVLLVPVVAGVSYEFMRAIGNSENKVVEFIGKPGIWFQMLTVRDPDNKMIEVAIVSVETIFNWREYQRRSLAAKKRQVRNGKPGRTEGVRRKSRAELAEEIRIREEENARRANERARRMMEQERKEAELERLVDEAERRKLERESMKMQQRTNQPKTQPDDLLQGLDHYFDGSRRGR